MTVYNSNYQTKYQRQKCSLRSKMYRELKLKKDFSRNQTKILLLNKDGKLEDTETNESYKEKINFENELEHWQSIHHVSIKNDFAFNSFYEEILELILNFITTAKIKTENPASILKQMMNESGANLFLLDLPREERKLIFRRLDSLLLKMLPFHLILKDSSVKKIIIENTLRIFYQIEDRIKVKKHSIFITRLEARVFNLFINAIHFQNPQGRSKIHSLDYQSFLLANTTGEQENLLTIRPIHHRATTLLDLMREKTLTTAHGPLIIKYLNKAEQGMLISGETSSGKTKVLASFLSAIVNSKFIAFTGDPNEFRNISKDFQLVDEKLIFERQKNQTLECLADSLANSGINYYVSDDSSPLEFSLAYVLHLKHGIPSLITLTARNKVNTILHYINSSMSLLQYKDEREFFLWNIARAFPMLFSISPNDKINEGKLYKINNNNGVIKFLPLSIEKPEISNQLNL